MIRILTKTCTNSIFVDVTNSNYGIFADDVKYSPRPRAEQHAHDVTNKTVETTLDKHAGKNNL